MDNSKVEEGYATVGPYRTEGIAVKVSTALSLLAMFLVLVMGWAFASLKADQEADHLLVEENNVILKQLVIDLTEQEDNGG